MKTVYDLLLAAPDEQTKRCQLAYDAILVGSWKDAAAHLKNAADEEGSTAWAAAARALADRFAEHSDPDPESQEDSAGRQMWVKPRADGYAVLLSGNVVQVASSYHDALCFIAGWRGLSRDWASEEEAKVRASSYPISRFRYQV